MSKGKRYLLAAAVVLGLLLGLNAYTSSQADPEPEAPPTTTAPPANQLPPTSTAPARKLHRLSQDRPRDDQLRGLPNLNFPVFAYAGSAPDAFSNAVVVMLGAKIDPCRLFFGVDEKGWKLAVEDGVTPYPNDHFPIRVFVDAPCPAMSGVAEPQQVKPA